MASPNDLRDNIRGLLRKHDAINGVYRRAEEALKEEIGGIDWSQMRPEDAKEARDDCEHMHQSIRQAILVILYSYLEAGMDLMGNQFVRGYTKEIRKNKGEGSFKARLRVFADSDIDFAPARDEGDIAEALRLIRNCLVHAGGCVAKSTEKKKLEDAIRRLQEDCEESNCQSIEIRDGHIFLHDDVLSLVNCTSHNLVWDLYGAAMRTGPNKTTM